MKTTYIALGVVLVILIAAGAFFFMGQKATAPVTETTTQTPEEHPATSTPAAPGKLKVANFTGTLQSVNTGCFADGECYVVVDGKHVTAIRGWSQETVGTVEGVEGFGDLESHIGGKVEVYAKDNGDSTYTLYGSEGFYIKLVK